MKPMPALAFTLIYNPSKPLYLRYLLDLNFHKV
jgi:hypothetical protein